MLAIGGLLASAYDVAHNQFLKLTSSVTVAVMGNLKVSHRRAAISPMRCTSKLISGTPTRRGRLTLQLVLLILLSMLFLERRTQLKSIIGVLIGLGGVYWYSWQKLETSAAEGAEEAAGASKPIGTAAAAGESSKLIP